MIPCGKTFSNVYMACPVDLVADISKVMIIGVRVLKSMHSYTKMFMRSGESRRL